MSFLSKLKQKWSDTAKAKQAKEVESTMNPELRQIGYEILFDQLLQAMNPANYVVDKDGDTFVVMERYAILDDEKELTGDYEWRKRYSHDHDSKVAGHFTTFDKALSAVKKIIKQAAKDFDQVKKQLENE